eukprot:1157869-Pelagomonas_calceolata.AAC.3
MNVLRCTTTSATHSHQERTSYAAPQRQQHIHIRHECPVLHHDINSTFTLGMNALRCTTTSTTHSH